MFEGNTAHGDFNMPAGSASSVSYPSTFGKREVQQWLDVGIIKGTSCLVTHYFQPNEGDPQQPEHFDVVTTALAHRKDLFYPTDV